MPLSTTTVQPERLLVRRSSAPSISSTVVASLRLPAKLSWVVGKPSPLSTSPTTTCLRSGRWSRD
jgi:hypothetical protein